MNHEEAIDHNVAKANQQLSSVVGAGDVPVSVASVHLDLAKAYMLGALVSAVRELSDEVRQLREAR